jgi:hypothetical protein
MVSLVLSEKSGFGGKSRAKNRLRRQFAAIKKE